jgi:hypothetical protein
MIEVIEQTNHSGTNATVVGGKQIVTITAQAAVRHPARHSTCDARVIKAYTSPAGYWVKHSGGSKFVTAYDRAVSLAVYHANRI